MHLHLDPVGGVAGDMFAAAMLDLRPEWARPLAADVEASGLGRYFRVRAEDHRDHALAGRRFAVDPGDEATPHDHRAIRGLIEDAGLAPAVRDRALDLFRVLAEAEGRVHGVAADDVHFHEIGDHDSLGDLVSAAWLMERAGPATWSSAPLPMGRGRVETAHGTLPVPAPATALILEGMPVFWDSHEGERVTPTGAAIVRHLDPGFAPDATPRRLAGSGVGFGTRTFPGMSNVLRVLAFEEAAEPGRDRVAEVRFDLDDQAPEDLAVALERLRAREGVLDVLQAPAFGKKGRMVARIQVLARPEHLDRVLDDCLVETSSLGVRWQILSRRVLPRREARVEVDGRSVRLKHAVRPGGATSAKAEMDDLAGVSGGYTAREALRRRAEDGDDRDDRG